MLHGMTLLIVPKNSNSYYLLWNYSTNLPVSTTAGPSHSTTHRNIITTLQMGPLSLNFLRFSCLCWSSSHNLHLITKLLLNNSLQTKRPQLLPAWRLPWKSHTIFFTETSFGEAIALARLSPPPRALHRHTRVPCKLSHSFARSILIDLLGITNLLCLSPNKLGMPIYHIYGIAFKPLRSNSTKCCTHLMSQATSSALLWTHHSATYNANN